MRWILERYEFPFDVVANDALNQPEVAARYDILIYNDDLLPARNPGVAPVKAFVEAGGTLMAVGASTSIGAQLGLGIVDALAGVTREQYYVPGSILRLRVDNTLPLAYGFERHVDVFFDNSPVFRLQPDAPSRRVAWFDSVAPLRSGWAWGQQHLHDTIPIVEATLGRGRVLLFGPEVTFRAQPHGTFKFLFNAILSSAMEPARLR
jgi:hypothetical protein